MRADLDAVKTDCVSVGLTFAQIELGLSSLREKVGKIEKSFVDFKDKIVRLVVVKILELRKAESRGMSHLNEHIKHQKNESKRKPDEFKRDSQRKSSEGEPSQSLVVL